MTLIIGSSDEVNHEPMRLNNSMKAPSKKANTKISFKLICPNKPIKIPRKNPVEIWSSKNQLLYLTSWN